MKELLKIPRFLDRKVVAKTAQRRKVTEQEASAWLFKRDHPNAKAPAPQPVVTPAPRIRVRTRTR